MALHGEYWRIALVILPGLAILLTYRRLPRWVIGAWALLTGAVALAWVVGLSWPGTLVLFAGFTAVASALWLRAEERAVSPSRGSRGPAGRGGDAATSPS